MALRGIANQANTTTSTTCVITVNGIGIQLSDIVLLFINGGGSGTNVYTYPSGFNAISGLAGVNIGGGSTTMGCAYKVATGSEPSTYTITSNQTDFMTGHCRVYSGRNTSSTFTATSSTGPTSTPSFPISYSATGVTAAAADDVVIWLATVGGNTTGETLGLTGPTGFGNQGSIYGNVQFSPRIAYADYVNNPGGATGALTGSWTDPTGGSPISYGAYVLSLAASVSNAATIAWVV